MTKRMPPSSTVIKHPYRLYMVNTGHGARAYEARSSGFARARHVLCLICAAKMQPHAARARRTRPCVCAAPISSEGSQGEEEEEEGNRLRRSTAVAQM